MVNYKYKYYIIDTLTNEIAINEDSISTDEEALATLEYLNSGIAESGGYPNFKLEVLPRIIIGGFV